MNENEKDELWDITRELDDYIMCALSEINDSPSLVDASIRLHCIINGSSYEDELEEWKDALGNDECWEQDKLEFLITVGREKGKFNPKTGRYEKT